MKAAHVAILALPAAPATSALALWSVPVNIGSPVSTPSAELSYSLTGTGRLMVISRMDVVSSEFSIWEATWSGSWQAPVKLPAPINVGATDYSPYISPGDATLLFSSDRAGTVGDMDLWMSTRSGSTWSTPQSLAGVNGLDSDMSPVLSSDRMVLITGPGPGNVFGAQLRGFNWDDESLTRMSTINAFVLGAGFRYGLTTASGNVDSDSFDEITVGSGPDPAYSNRVQLLDYDANALVSLALINPFAAVPAGVRGTVGEFDGDEFDEIAIAAAQQLAAKHQVLGFNWDGGRTLAGITSLSFGAFPSYGAKIGSALLGH